MAPRQIVHGLLILSEVIIISSSLMMIIKYDRTSKKHKIWTGSKILTLKKEMKNNTYELHPILDINDMTEYNQNYESLLKHSSTNCENNYKKCGILDTYGNIMCIPEEDDCPINDIKIDLISKSEEYLYDGYKIANLYELSEGFALYYTNKKINNEIVVKIKFSDEIPRYINEKNFIFDQDSYDRYYPKGDYDSDGYDYGGYDYGGDYGGGDYGGGGDVGSGGGGFRNLDDYDDEIYGDSKMTNYIYDRFNDDINIDKSYKNIYDNFYVGNYIGFKDISNLNEYINHDLYESYFTVFPNLTADIFCYISSIVMIILIIYSFIRFCHKDIPNEGFDSSAVLSAKLMLIIPYLIIFIGYYIYIIYEYFNIYKNNNPKDLKNIKADSFIENLLEEINDRHLEKIYIIVLIILFSLAIIIFILAWILSSIFTCRYMKLLKISNT